MKDLLSQETDQGEDNQILSIIKRLANSHLPEGWHKCRIVATTKNDILGGDSGPLILDKIRFALPTAGLARAFSPECTSLPERVYRDIS